LAVRTGVPSCIASSTGSLPEVAGSAAMSVDPYSVPSIAAGLRALESDPDLAARLAAEGLIQADKFSEERYRERLDAMYAGIMAGPG
jgi:hypothetical protein